MAGLLHRRKVGEKSVIETEAGPITITTVKVKGRYASLLIDAPRSMTIYRGECEGRQVKRSLAPDSCPPNPEPRTLTPGLEAAS